MYSRVLAIALCVGLMMPSGTIHATAEGSSKTSPFVVLGIFAGVCFVFYKGATTYERYCLHNRAIKLVNDLQNDPCLKAEDIVTYSQTKYKSSSHPLICAYTHLTKMRKRLKQASIDLGKDPMVQSYSDCAELHGQACALIHEINSVLPVLEQADGFKDQFDRYMLSTVPSMVDSIQDLKDEMRRNHCNCN